MKTVNKEKKVKKYLENVREIVHDWAENTTGHGFPNIVRANSTFVAIAWTLCLATSTGLCAYMIYRNITAYISFQAVTQIKSYHEIPTVFPSISICNLNALTKKEMGEKLLGKLDNVTNSTINLNETDTEYFENKAFGYLNGIYDSKLEMALNELNDSEKKQLGYSLKEFVISCTFNEETCTATDFKWFYSPGFGNCFTFNSGFDDNGTSIPLKTVQSKGGTLLLELFVGIEENFYITQSGLGARIYIHNSTLNTQLFTLGYNVMPGVKAYFAVNRQFHEILPLPYNDCQQSFEDIKIYTDYMSKNNYSYNQEDCFKYLYQYKTMKKCNCHDPYAPKLNDSSVSCFLGGKSEECFNENAQELYIFNELYKYVKECPLECSSSSLSVDVTQLEYLSEYYFEILRNSEHIKKRFNNTPITYERVQKSISSFLVNYNDMSYTVISESEQMSLIDLVASIGGTLGLFIGISVLSFIELFEVGLRILVLTCKSLIPNKRRTSKINSNSKEPNEENKANKTTLEVKTI